MLFSTSTRALASRFRAILDSFQQHDGLPFAEVLSAEDIEAACEAEGVNFGQDNDAVYTPSVTLWASLSQTLFADKHRSYVAAVARVIVMMAALGRQVSGNTSAYTRARFKLPETLLERLAIDVVADRSERAIPEDWLWCGRHVHLVDGTTLSMPDTDANQEAWPQATTQAKGLGFPIVRIVVMLSLATAMLTGMKLGPYAGKETGETALFRQLLDRFSRGDIFVADRFYCSYFMIALARQHGIDCAVRLHHKRTADFRKGTRLGRGDHIVRWQRPARPTWMDEETYAQMPECIEVREVYVSIDQPGFRTESLVVVSTLLDGDTYSKRDLAELYHKRWLVELDIRDIKVALGMDVLRCKSPSMVLKEIWTCLLSYNLIRKVILEAAYKSGRSPRQISFTAAMQQVAAGWTTVLVMDESQRVLLLNANLEALAKQRVGHRPDRAEPRAVKRRSKPHKLLTKPRNAARHDKDLVAGTSKG